MQSEGEALVFQSHKPKKSAISLTKHENICIYIVLSLR